MEQLKQLLDIIKENKAEIFISEEILTLNRHNIIETYKENPDLLMKLLKETTKAYKPIKNIKNLLIVKGFTTPIKDKTLKLILENFNFN